MQTIMLMLLAALLGGFGYYEGRKFWARYQWWRELERRELERLAQTPSQPAVAASAPAADLVTPEATIDLSVLPGAGQALASPPGQLRTALAEIQLSAPTAQYSIPLGWFSVGPRHALLHAALVNDVNHILVTGTTDVGKDTLVQNMLFALTDRYGPEKLQIAIVDGKSGLSWNGWHTKAHTWLFARKSKDILPAMEALTKERERREEILWDAKVEKWEQYQGKDLPLLVVFISELLLLQSATSRSALAQWMNDELSSARSSGIRYIVATQTVTNFDTTWRSNISLLCAGYQTLNSADEPNSTFTTKALRELGIQPDGTVIAVAPSDLPAPSKNAPNKGGCGVFTCVQGRAIFTVRAGLLSDAERRARLETMADDPKKIAAIEHARREVELADNPLLSALINKQPLPFADEPTPVARPTEPVRTTALPEIIASKTLAELERDQTFIESVRAAYRRHGVVRKVVIELFPALPGKEHGWTGSRDRAVVNVLRTVGDMVDTSLQPTVQAA